MLPILWNVCEEHLDEGAFLYGQWERACSAADYTIEEVSQGVQAQLLAHLAGLVVGGRPVAEHLLVPALSSDDPARSFAAAWALLRNEQDDHLEMVWEALLGSTAAASRAALARAFELCGRPDVVTRLSARLHHPAAVARACVLDVLATHQPERLARIDLGNLDVEAAEVLLASVLRALQHVPSGHELLIERALQSPVPDVRAAALEVGTRRKMPQTRPVCRRIVAERGPDRRLAMALLALQGEERDLERLEAWANDPDLAVDALWALGFSGAPRAMAALVTHFDDSLRGPMAADSFQTLTGMPVAPAPAASRAPSAEPLDVDAAVPELHPEGDLPMPDAVRARAEWHVHRARFDGGARYVMGERWSDPALLLGLRRAPTWRRQVLHLGLSAHAAGRVRLRDWVDAE